MGGNVGIGVADPICRTSIFYAGNNDSSTTHKQNFGLQIHNTMANGPNNRSNLILFTDGNSTQSAIGGYRNSHSSDYSGGLVFLVGSQPSGYTQGTPGSTDQASGSLTEAMRIDHNGSVIIGISNPGAKLQVNGNASIANTLSVSEQTVGTPIIVTYGNYNSSNYTYQPIIRHSSQGGVSGYNGISAEIGVVPVYNGSWVQGPGTAMQFKLANFSAESNCWGNCVDNTVMTLTGWGSVGIGVTNPITLLHVKGFTGYTTAGLIARYETNINSAEKNVGLDIVLRNSDSTGGSPAGSYAGINAAMYGVANVPIVLHDSGGNVGIGITNPSHTLHVNGNMMTSGVVGFGTDPIGNYTLVVQHRGHPWQVPGYYFTPSSPSLIQTGGGISDAAIVAFGSIVATAAIASLSDKRIKKDIKPLSYSIEDLLALKPVEYYFKDTIQNSNKQIGFIAQQVKEVIPEIVNESEGIVPDAYQVVSVLYKAENNILVHIPFELDWKVGDIVKVLSNTSIINNCKVLNIQEDKCLINIPEKYEEIEDKVFLYGRMIKDVHNIDYSKLTPLLVKSVQEQQQTITQQSQTISQQSQQIQDLHARLSRLESLLSR
jgi:hypothetical protein